MLQNDAIPYIAPGSSLCQQLREPLLDEFWTRYNAARAAADEAWERKCVETPIDDAAWAEELERRRLIELRDA